MLIQLAVEVAVETWLIVNEPAAVAVSVVEGRMLTPWMPMPAAMPVGEVAQVTVFEFNVVPIWADWSVVPPPSRELLKAER